MNVLELVSEERPDAIERAIIISLFSWSRANDENGKPIYGWWGDSFNADNDKIGSTLWQLRRNKISNQLMLQTQDAIKKALSWMIRDNIANKIDVKVESENNNLSALITIDATEYYLNNL